MKRSLTIPGLLAKAAVDSYAQSVTLFGLVDAALERVSNIGPGGASLMRLPSLTGALALSVSAGAGGSNPAAGASQSAVAAGIRHSF